MRRLFSLSGVLPLGIFFVAHLWTNAHALSGDASFTIAQQRTAAIPGLFMLELLFVFAPLALHAAYGTWLTVTRRALPGPSVYSPAVRTMMRVTGVVALAFVAFHLVELRIPMATEGMRASELHTALSARLSTTTWTMPLRAMFYMVGLAAVAFHFAAGLWGYCVSRSWSHLASARARVSAAIGFGAIGLTLFVVGADVVTLFATGARLIGRDQVTPLAIDSFASPSACPPVAASAQPPSSSP